MKIFKLILLMFACVMQGTILAASVAAPQEGEASYYADSLNGRKTASGGIYDKNALSAAHPPTMNHFWNDRNRARHRAVGIECDRVRYGAHHQTSLPPVVRMTTGNTEESEGECGP